MSWNAAQEIHHAFILAPGQESMIPGFNHMLLCNRFDFRKIHDHALIGRASCGNDRATEGYFYRVAMAVQVLALAGMVGNTVTGVEFQSAGYAHGVRIIPFGLHPGRYGRAPAYGKPRFSPENPIKYAPFSHPAEIQPSWL